MTDLPVGSPKQSAPSQIFRDAELKILLEIVKSVKPDGMPRTDFKSIKKLQEIIDEAEVEALLSADEQMVTAYKQGYERDKKHDKEKDAAITAALVAYKTAKNAIEQQKAMDTLKSWMNFTASNTVTKTNASITAATRAFRFSSAKAQINTVNQSIENYTRGGVTWTQAKQDALDGLAKRGITSFVDKSGKQWQIDTYVDMCVRTGIANASRAGFDQSMEERGIDLVYVSAHRGSCPLCIPWEGVVLSRSGAAGYPSVAEAEDARLFHPNCGHVLFEYIDGYSNLRKYDSPENNALYQARQDQRYMERNIRMWERRKAVAITPKEKAYASRYVKKWDSTIEKHTSSNGIPRKRYRERL